MPLTGVEGPLAKRGPPRAASSLGRAAASQGEEQLPHIGPHHKTGPLQPVLLLFLDAGSRYLMQHVTGAVGHARASNCGCRVC